jgi:DNA-binding transcriptional LysR family regulator
MITLDRLRYFITVAQTEHVGQAASKMHISASVISSAIKDLEETLGYPLFIRKNNRIKITNDAQILLEKAQRLLNDVDEIENLKNRSKQSLRGHYKIGASHFLMSEFLVPAFLRLKKLNPLLTAEFVSLDSGLAISQVKSGILDGVLVFRSSYHEKISESLLCEGHFDLFVKAEHPILKMTNRRKIDQLNKLPALSFRSSQGANFWEKHPAFSSLGISPDYHYFYDDTETALQLLRETDGWAFLPHLIAKKNRKIKSLNLANRETAPVNISLVANKNARTLLFFEKLEEDLREMLRTLL